MRKLLLISATALIAAGAPAQARHHAAAMMWMDGTAVGLPAGAKVAVVSGDPSKDGPFVVSIKMPAGYTVPPHHHPTDEVVRVTSGGSLTYGMGDKVDTSNSGTLTKGYHVTMQSGMNHWVTASDAAVVQVSGTGPFAIVYVNPADDPRGAK
jgi:quercetin dioxygenase-like cupin family protein